MAVSQGFGFAKALPKALVKASTGQGCLGQRPGHGLGLASAMAKASIGQGFGQDLGHGPWPRLPPQDDAFRRSLEEL